MREKLVGLLMVGVVLAGCGDGESAKDVSASADVKDVAGESGGDVTGDGPVQDLAGLDSAVDGSSDSQMDVLQPPVPFGPENRGWTVLKGIIHLHSAYSHDGCAPDGYEDFGGPNPACLDELRAAACNPGMDFLMMTDHPGFVKDHTYEEGLLHMPDKGDELLKDSKGRPFTNRINCPQGSPVEKCHVFFGTEGHKNMPIAMSGTVPPEVFGTSYDTGVPIEKVHAAVAMTHDLEGYAFGVHTEDNEVTVERIIEIPLDGMEVYNLHSNFMTSLEGMESIFQVDRFMEAGPDPDLSLLLFLSVVEESVSKYDKAAAVIRLGAIGATDIHRNVEIPALCPEGVEGSLCEGFAEDYPNFTQFAVTGGPVPLSDGDRMDSYARSFRWFANRVLAQSADPDDLRKGVGAGRTFTAFDMFGTPDGFDFLVTDETGAVYELGQEFTLQGAATAWLRIPTLGAPHWRADAGINFSKAQLTTRVIRATPEGPETIFELEGQGKSIELPLPGVGAYRVEISIMPKHLKPLLDTVEDLMWGEYPYLYASAVFVR